MKLRWIPLLLVVASCGGEQPMPVTDTRDAIAVEYVNVSKLEIHDKPAANAPVIATFDRAESVSVLSKKDGWSEVRVGGGTGWARSSELNNAVTAKALEADNLTPRFRKIPSAVTQTTARGELIFEADVNLDGDVVNVRTLRNTTGSMALEAKNRAALQEAKFQPIVVHGQRRSFVYEYRVHY